MSWLIKSLAMKVLELILKEGIEKIEDKLSESPNNTMEKK